MEFDEDDWFFRSVKEYEDLYMYDLQRPATVLSWSRQKEACISCSLQRTRSELLHLRLPPNLAHKDEQVITKDRDFKVTGGVQTDSLITDLQYMEPHRLLLSAEEGENCIQTWRLPESEHGLIRNEKKYSNLKKTSMPAKLAVPSTDTPNHVAFGSHGNNICLADVECGSVNDIGLEASDLLCRLKWTGPNTLLAACQDSGDLWSIDTRQKLSNKLTDNDGHNCKKSGPWVMDCSPSTGHVYMINTEGVVKTMNINNPHKFDLFNLEEQINSANIQFTLQAAPTQDGTFSVSGHDGCVYIYIMDYKEGEPLTASFVHQGHLANTTEAKVKVIDHIWHPTIPCLLLSAGNDCSLHAWKYYLHAS